MLINKKLAVFIMGLLVMCTANPVFAKLNVFACEPEWAALTQVLGGDNVKVFSATNGAQDPHHIQARPSLLNKARQADLLVCTGAELEIGWLPILQRKTGNPAIQVGTDGYFMASNAISMLDVPTVLDRSEGDVHAMGNPHIQTDPNNISDVAEALNQRLQLISWGLIPRCLWRYKSIMMKSVISGNST